MNIITFCDFFRKRFGRSAELMSAILIIPSYFSWIAAQLLAMGIVLKIVFGWSLIQCILLSSGVVILYTIWGGMWSISITDFIQTLFIIAGLVLVTVILWRQVGSWEVLTKGTSPDFFRFYPRAHWKDWVEYFAAWITIGLGSIPQQDVFQRVMSAKTAKVSVKATLVASFMYITIALLPIFIGFAGVKLYPDLAADGQLIIPNMVLMHTGPVIQIMFFGALVSAILSTTSSAIMAPATIFGENIVKFFKPELSDKQLLRIIRWSILIITLICIGLAVSRESIFELVAESSVFSLVSLFVPLVAGVYWKRASQAGSLLSMILGLSVWILAIRIDTEYPPMLFGLLASLTGMIVGSSFRYPLPGNTKSAL